MKLNLAGLVAAATACTQLVQAAPILCLVDMKGCGGTNHTNTEFYKEWLAKQKGSKNGNSGVGLFGIPNKVWHTEYFRTLVMDAYSKFLTSPTKSLNYQMGPIMVPVSGKQ